MTYRDSYRLWCPAPVIIAVLMLLLLFPMPSEAQQTAAPLPLDKAGWHLTFDEEFNGRRLNPRKWTIDTGSMPNRSAPLQYFLPSAVVVGHGILRIQSKHQTVYGYKYTSGEIRTLDKFSQKYGRLETRCCFPKAYGTWSAVYLLPADDSWPPEIDAAEYIGCDPQTVYLTNHWMDAAGQHQQVNENWTDPKADWGGWHTYTVEWKPNTVHWYIDGVLRGTAIGPVSDKPMYIRVNSSVGGNFAREPHPGSWPQTFQISYIRVYQHQGGPAPIFGPVPRFAPPPPIPISGNQSAFVMPEPVSPPTPSALATQSKNYASGFVVDLAVILLVWAGMQRRVGADSAWTAALAAGVGVSAFSYLFFRVQVIHWAAWWIALPLLLAEAHGLFHAVGLQYTLWPRPPLEINTGSEQRHRPIFIFIPTVNEGVGVLKPTITGALAARACYQSEFPETEVTIIVCNDGFVAGYPEWQEIERLAETLGVTCVTRPTGGGAKAGNIEFARQSVGAVGDALLVLFDADQIAETAFLLRTVPPFADPSIGWVQTGQYYRNLENPVARWSNDQQGLFYSVLCPGKAALNSAFICGTNVVIRASALDEIGGLPQDSVTEDFAASLLLHPHWRSLFLTEVLATGLGPMDLPSYFAQQGRWATGTLSTLRRHWRMIFLPKSGGLSPAQRVQYGLACTHYLSGLRDLIYLGVPFVFLLMGISAISGTDLPTFLSRFLPYYFLSQIAFWRAARGKTTLRGIALSFGSFPVLLASLLLVILGQRVRFAITPKSRNKSKKGTFLLVQILAGSGCLVGLLMALASPEDRGRVLLSALWLLTMLVMLASVLWLGIRDRHYASKEG
ncbi:MAG: family 16 glycosylhydrolase [Janthinobacterium lividum]